MKIIILLFIILTTCSRSVEDQFINYASGVYQFYGIVDLFIVEKNGNFVKNGILFLNFRYAVSPYKAVYQTTNTVPTFVPIELRNNFIYRGSEKINSYDVDFNSVKTYGIKIL